MFWLTFIVLIVCATILFAMYMYYCSENCIHMFETPRYDERILKLEYVVTTLEKKIKEMESK